VYTRFRLFLFGQISIHSMKGNCYEESTVWHFCHICACGDICYAAPVQVGEAAGSAATSASAGSSTAASASTVSSAVGVALAATGGGDGSNTGTTTTTTTSTQ
jgi:hypothetical protein